MNKYTVIVYALTLLAFLWYGLESNADEEATPDFVHTLAPMLWSNVTYSKHHSKLVIADLAQEFYDYHALSDGIKLAQWIVWTCTLGRAHLVYAPYVEFEALIREAHHDCTVSISKSKDNDYTLESKLSCGMSYEHLEQVARETQWHIPFIGDVKTRVDAFMLEYDDSNKQAYTNRLGGHTATAYEICAYTVFMAALKCALPCVIVDFLIFMFV